ncbi:MAG: OmpH family outer membrane protein [Zetaproteobacteria bacterium]|nr:OmpH family outer membrane protein [Zetaproteobacteria bacterium]
MKKYLLGMVAAFALMNVAVAEEAVSKVGYVDVKLAVENTTAFREGMKKLEDWKQKKSGELKSQFEHINALQTELQTQAMVISPEVLNTKNQEIDDLSKQFSRNQQDAQAELQKRRNQLYEGVLNRFETIVRDYGKEQKFAMISQASSLVYGDAKFDVTADITKLLDAQSKGKK